MRTTLTLILCVLFVAVKAQDAYIQVQADPGISVFLDGAFKGKTSSEMGGLIIENVSPCMHTIKVLKEGYNVQEDRISVQPGEVYSYKVSPFIPKLKITESGNTGQQELGLKVGSLKIQSLPLSVRILIPALDVDYLKSKDEWQVEEVPAGKYQVEFRGMNKSITDTVEIEHNQLTHIFVNLVSGEIEMRRSNIETYPENNLTSYNRATTLGTDDRNGPTYALGSRKAVGQLLLPNVADCNITNRIVVTIEIQVDRVGNVVGTSVQSATYADNCIWKVVVEAARRTKFSNDANASFRQTGWIKYTIEP